jgi:hypothetical protein
MTVIYHGANDGLHAFSGESGEELWSFVPFDQLGKIYTLARMGQTRDNHVYMIGSAVRAVDVFVPGSFTVGTRTYTGRWRTFLMFGRGPGGKHYTVLDVTAPGPYTRAALRTNPPWVVWSRGNPDTDNGATYQSGVNKYNNDVTDYTNYQGMGESWSTPAIGNVSVSSTSDPEWQAWVGSGYSETTTNGEGKYAFAINVLNGDIINRQFVGDGSKKLYIPDNALVADMAIFNGFQLDPPGTSIRSADVATRAYIPDIHGRVWKFLVGSTGLSAPGLFAGNSTVKNNGGTVPDCENEADPTACPPALSLVVEDTQPFGSQIALMRLASGTGETFVLAASGLDERVNPDTTNVPFRMFGWEDPGGDVDNSAPGILHWAREIKDLDGNVYRSSSAPAVTFNSVSRGRVFFTGRRLVPPATGECLSHYDSIVFTLGVRSGSAVFDNTGLMGSDSDAYFILSGDALLDVQVAGGRAFASLGTNSGGDFQDGTSATGIRDLSPSSDPVGSKPNKVEPTTISATSERIGSSICR